MTSVKERTHILICLILFVFISGCEPIEESELYGTYIAKYSFGGSEKLILSSDGRYSQEVNVVINGSTKTVQNSGSWSYNPTNKYLRLKDFLIVVDGFGKLKKNYDTPFSGYAVEPVSQIFPWSPIKIGSGEGLLYIKTE